MNPASPRPASTSVPRRSENPAGPPTSEPEARHERGVLVALAGAGAFTLTQAAAFVRAFAELNVNPPSREGILSWMADQYLAGLVALALALWATGWRRRTAVGLGLGAMAGWIVGALLATDLRPSLGPDGQFAWMNRFYLLAAILTLALGAALVGFARKREAWALPSASGAIAFHVTTYVALASVFLAHLGPLEEEARRVSPSPAWGLITAIAACLVAAWAVHRRARAAEP